MIASIFSGVGLAALLGFGAVIVLAYLVRYALRTKGDVFAELSHGKTSLRFDARERAPRDRQLRG